MKRRKLLIAAGATAATAGAGAYHAARGPDRAAAALRVRTAAQARSNADMAYLVHHAVLAANSHNTQPWRFHAGNRTIRIAPDPARATPVAMPYSMRRPVSAVLTGE